MGKRLTIDEVLKSFVLIGDAVIRSADIKKKIIWDVQYVDHPDFPWRIRVTCNKVNYGMALPRKITLKDFEDRFAEKIDEIKSKQKRTSLFEL